MVTTEALREQFLNLGVSVADIILEKCQEICITNKVEEEEFVEIWMAYSLSHLGGADPTLDSLGQMERKEFAKKEPEVITPSRKQDKSFLVIYNASNVDELQPEEILSVYNTTPKAKGSSILIRDRASNHRPGARCSSASMFSPASFSPTTATPSSKYAERTNSGSAMCTFGDVPPSTWGPTTSTYSPTLKPLQQVPVDALYMFSPLRDIASALDETLHCLGEHIVAKNFLEDLQDIHTLHSDQFTCLGRVCCDANGRLNSSSVLLQGPSEYQQPCTPVNLMNMERYSLFPGQIVALTASNPTGKCVLASQVYCDATPSAPSKIPTNDALQIVFAAGPYSQRDTLLYQPLEDLVNYLCEHQPHVAILAGPFIDANHERVLNGDLAESFHALFEKIIEGIMLPLKGLNTQVVLVASGCDAHHHMVFPTQPFILRKRYANLHMVGDPCLLDIDGLVVGVTTADILMHLGKEEISYPALGSDRLGRLASHLLAQQSFYPLYPPASEMNVDLELWAQYTQLTVKPHILLLPSNLHNFIKDIDGCVVVNPERLAKGNVGGSFARLEVRPSDVEKWSAKYCYGQVVKI